MEWELFTPIHEESTGVCQPFGIAQTHGMKNAQPLTASTSPFDMMMSSYRPYVYSTHFKPITNATYDCSTPMGDLITGTSIKPFYISDSNYNRQHENYLHHRSSLDCHEWLKNNHPCLEYNNQVVRKDDISSSYPDKLGFIRTTELSSTLQRQLANQLNHPSSSQKSLISRNMICKTNGNTNTRFLFPSQSNIGNMIDSESRFRNIKDHIHSSDRLPGPENLELKCKKNLELDAASTLCSLSIIQPKMIDEKKMKIEPSMGDTSKSEENFPTRLSMPNDESELNSLHCFVRKELLEIFFYRKEKISLAQTFAGCLDDISDKDCSIKKEALTSPHYNLKTQILKVSSLADSDRSNDSLCVGLRCVYCAHLHMTSSVSHSEGDNTESSVLLTKSLRMNAIYPKSIVGIYRLVCKWQRVHFKKCEHIPLSVKKKYDHLKNSDKTRGKTKYWVSSAIELGLVDDIKPRGGIKYDATKRWKSLP